VTAGKLVTFSDLMILAMAFPNVLGLLLLSGVVKRQLDEYMGKLRRGEMPLHTKPVAR
jgi:AGCS family alanine or glycine:cation symporter